ncbi:hypothetical protein [Bacillus toyonensis]|uniref:hypothetical protein n=1 Tax=Bacillus toyonensis TaxID=155322 RepID=UPI000BEE62BA|nr:hypothetical protein [Bacillus toyonensis]PEC68153.1 hypothetical protein CON62_06810 [Bacillus toyonensis]
MNLTPEERRMVFEQEKMRKEEEMKEKLDTLTGEEREKIFNEELTKSQVFLNSNSLRAPFWDKKAYWILCIIHGFIFMLFGLIAFVVVIILSIVIGFIWDRNSPSAIVSYKAYFNCPSCKNSLWITVANTKKEIDYPMDCQWNCVHCNQPLDIHYKK